MAGRRKAAKKAVKKAVERSPGLLGRAARGLGGRMRRIEAAVEGAQARPKKKKRAAAKKRKL